MEPITLFAPHADPAAVARVLRERCPGVEIAGPDADWRTAVVRDGDDTLTLHHDPNYYGEPNWSRQMAGMRGYFSRFPESPARDRVLTLTTALRFSIGTVFDPDFDPEGDFRLTVLFAVAEAVDAVLFTPSGLRDAAGRILCAADGEVDDDAVWPRVSGSVPADSPAGQAMHEMSRPKPPDDDELTDEDDPPTADRVVRRALALAALTARAILEQDVANPDTPAMCRDLIEWVGELDLEGEFEPAEWAVVRTPPGELDARAQTNATWRLEGLVVLAWALGRFEIPPHDRLVELNPLWRSLGLLDTDAARALLDAPTLRPRDAIVALRNRLFAVHWRLRDFHINRKSMDFAEFARTCWFGPLDIAGLPLVDGDLAIGGDRLDRAERDAVGSAHSAAQERHQAANWLRQGPATYSAASVAT